MSVRTRPARCSGYYLCKCLWFMSVVTMVDEPHPVRGEGPGGPEKRRLGGDRGPRRAVASVQVAAGPRHAAFFTKNGEPAEKSGVASERAEVDLVEGGAEAERKEGHFLSDGGKLAAVDGREKEIENGRQRRHSARELVLSAAEAGPAERAQHATPHDPLSHDGVGRQHAVV